VFPLLVDNCGFREDNIPQLRDVSNFVKGQPSRARYAAALTDSELNRKLNHLLPPLHVSSAIGVTLSSGMSRQGQLYRTSVLIQCWPLL